MAEAAVAQTKRLVDPGSPSSEPFRALRLALQLPAVEHQNNVLLLTSAEQGEGKSTLAANYALVSAIGYRNVLLIDADLRRPTLHEFFGMPRSHGLVDLAASNGHLKEFTRSVPNFGTLDLLTAGSAIRRSGDLTSSARMAAISKRPPGHTPSSSSTLRRCSVPPMRPGSRRSPGSVSSWSSTRGPAGGWFAGRSASSNWSTRSVAGAVMNREGRLSAYGY